MIQQHNIITALERTADVATGREGIGGGGLYSFWLPN